MLFKVHHQEFVNYCVFCPSLTILHEAIFIDYMTENKDITSGDTRHLPLLVIDSGNSKTKIALFVQGLMTLNEIFDTSDEKSILAFVHHHQAKGSIQTFGVSTSGLSDLPLSALDVRWFGVHNAMPLHMDYTSPESLGSDRWALTNARYLETQKNFLLITMGTCITYNVVRNDCFMGGAISPGWSMRYKAMNAYTNGLPEATYNDSTSILGLDTHGSLQAGVDIAIRGELVAMAEQYKSAYDLQEVFICGGDAPRLSKHLKKYIFAPSNYELYALKRLHEYNQK